MTGCIGVMKFLIQTVDLKHTHECILLNCMKQCNGCMFQIDYCFCTVKSFFSLENIVSIFSQPAHFIFSIDKMILECYDFLFSQPTHYIFSIDKMILECYDFLWDGMQENIKKINKKRHPEIKSGKCLNARTDSEIKSLKSTSFEERMAQHVAAQEVNVDDVLPPAGNENAAPAVNENTAPAVNDNATHAVNENATSDDEETPGAYSDEGQSSAATDPEKTETGTYEEKPAAATSDNEETPDEKSDEKYAGTICDNKETPDEEKHPAANDHKKTVAGTYKENPAAATSDNEETPAEKSDEKHAGTICDDEETPGEVKPPAANDHKKTVAGTYEEKPAAVTCEDEKTAAATYDENIKTMRVSHQTTTSLCGGFSAIVDLTFSINIVHKDDMSEDGIIFLKQLVAGVCQNVFSVEQPNTNSSVSSLSQGFDDLEPVIQVVDDSSDRTQEWVENSIQCNKRKHVADDIDELCIDPPLKRMRGPGKWRCTVS